MTPETQKTMFSSNTDEWSTPPDFYEALDAEFHFDFDPCATSENHKCHNYMTKENDGLSASWAGRRVFVNPPYSEISRWVEKAFREGHQENTLVCLLIPARTDTKYFHDYIIHRSEIRFIKGRLKFGGGKNSAPFPSMLVIFRGPKM